MIGRDRARAEVLAVIKRGKRGVLSGTMVCGPPPKGLGYGEVNYVLTCEIGDGAGHWHQGPHFKALGDLIEDGTIECRQDKKEVCCRSRGR